MLADGVLAAEEILGEGLIDDGDLGAGGAFVAEVASGEAGDAHGFEVAGGGHVEVGDGPWAGGVGVAFDLEAVAAVASGEGHGVGGDGGDDAGEGGDALAGWVRSWTVRSGV